MKTLRDAQGFSILETLVVLAILAVIGASGYFLYLRQQTFTDPRTGINYLQLKGTQAGSQFASDLLKDSGFPANSGLMIYKSIPIIIPSGIPKGLRDGGKNCNLNQNNLGNFRGGILVTKASHTTVGASSVKSLIAFGVQNDTRVTSVTLGGKTLAKVYGSNSDPIVKTSCSQDNNTLELTLNSVNGFDYVYFTPKAALVFSLANTDIRYNDKSIDPSANAALANAFTASQFDKEVSYIVQHNN
ncbi:MAG TPA: prepilin-type N-terminal cleavage/methylation domain-containing protein [Candidatus Saccharimonadales bacterium]|nr:prepilin-type N-terminal cleavage/methylation domain-containing protein [Candidatus Saccharimonadales bacterium]